NTWKDGDLTTESLQKWTLLKTVKANKNAYTDKKLKPELTYTYKGEEIKEIKSGSKVTDTLIVSDTDTITLDFDGFEQFRKIENSDGSIKATWKKSVGVEGYKVYMTQYLKDANGSTTDQVEVEVASLPATAKSY